MADREFERIMLRGMNVLLNSIGRYAGSKTNDIIDEWKAEARDYLSRPLVDDDAELWDHYERTVAAAREQKLIA